MLVLELELILSCSSRLAHNPLTVPVELGRVIVVDVLAVGSCSASSLVMTTSSMIVEVHSTASSVVHIVTMASVVMVLVSTASAHIASTSTTTSVMELVGTTMIVVIEASAPTASRSKIPTTVE